MIQLLQTGLHCLERQHYEEGLVLFNQARQLYPDQMQLISLLHDIRKALGNYLRIRQALYDASKAFTEADTEQSRQVETLKQFLRSLEQGTEPPSSITPFPKNGQKKNLLPPLYITCFGRFEVRRHDPSSVPLRLCNNLKGQAILRYLITRPGYRETIDMLMAALWPEEPPEGALHKLRVAVSALRRSLNAELVTDTGSGYILCHGHIYQLNPDVCVHSDMQAFLTYYHTGSEAISNAAVPLFEKACQLYNGTFLIEDLYAEWSFLLREELNKFYITMCSRLATLSLKNQNHEAARRCAMAILKVDRCDEEAYRLLIQASAALGHRSEAVRYYHQCQKVLSEELGVPPMPETQQLAHLLLG
jgi:DNA-binding SARP family transcriptional activator